MKKTVSKSTSMDMMCNTWDLKKCALWTVVAIVIGFGISFFAAKCAVQSMEVMRAGGKDNYKMIIQLYKSDAWKQTQAMQIQQTMQALQSQSAGAGIPTEQAAPAATK